MRLWTIQNKRVIECLSKKGLFVLDEHKLDFGMMQEFNDQYLWMSSQLRKHLDQKEVEFTYPIWAWHTKNGETEKEKVISEIKKTYIKDDTEDYLIEIVVPKHKVLLINREHS